MIDPADVTGIVDSAFADGQLDDQPELTWFEFNQWLESASMDEQQKEAMKAYFQYFDIS